MHRWPGAILFDFDGVIVDSEPLHLRAYLDTAATWGIPLTAEQYYRELIGFDDRGAWTHLFKKSGQTIDAAELQRVIAHKLGVMRQILERREYRPIAGVDRLIEILRERGYPMAICSGALREEIETMLEGIGLREAFCAVISAQDVTIGKPDPSGYLLTARLVSEKIGRSLAPDECIIVEDAPNVIRSVHNVGFKTLAVATTYRAEELRDADWVVQSLDPETIGRAIPQLRFT